MKPGDETTTSDEILPTWDVSLPEATTPPVADAVPLATPVAEPVQSTEAVPLATPVLQEVPELPSPLVDPAAPPVILCPICGASRKGDDSCCADCGYYYSEADLAQGAAPVVAAPTATSVAPAPGIRLQDRFEVREQISERQGVTRFRGIDHGSGTPVPVTIVRQEVPRLATAVPAEEEEAPAPAEETGEEILPLFDDVPAPSISPTEILPVPPTWPGIAWERNLLTTLEHPGLPQVIDQFIDGEYEYLVEEAPTGQVLWDAWDDPEADARQRFLMLEQVAEILHQLHHYNLIVEGLRPEMIVISPEGRARLTDLGDLLPLPLPADVPLRGTLYTAPELLAGNATVDARADLYSFGAMLYALHVGRELTEKVDFDRPGQPKPFIPRFPDIHPAFGRLMSKTFRREVEARFPTDEAGKEDATGFLELIRTLRVLGRTLDNVRLEIAAWTTIGMVRTGNEDAFALLHSCESRQDDLGEAAVILLCDGMGGYEAGEVAAALAIQVMRQNLVQQKPFQHLAGASSFPGDVLSSSPPKTGESEGTSQGHAGQPLDVEQTKQLLKAALKEANKRVYTESRAPGSKRRGMGCTAEAVYIDGRNVVVGHVGDSRTYHLHEGRLIQLTRDQTLVNRLVELGTLSPEEAETHPRRNELQQAIGGQPDVEPGLSHGVMKAGDWVVVCSDGLTNHVTNQDLQQMLQGEGYSAETVARRLVNLANLQGATDNATVVVVRAT
jgi:serine/threonine protein phosphatase PrpC